MRTGTRTAVLLPAVILLATALAAALLTACGGAVITVGQTDSGTTVTAAKGDTIDLTLAENPSTGYSWKMKLSAGLEVTDDSYKEGDESQGLVGVPGTHNWRIEVVETGEQTITGEYRQAQNPDDNPEFFTLTVDVK